MKFRAFLKTKPYEFENSTGRIKAIFSVQLPADEYTRKEAVRITWCHVDTLEAYANDVFEHGNAFCQHNKDILEWCEQNCTSRWGYKLSKQFFFTSQKDKIMFCLRWL